jgi:predicted metalloprotease with PDZ domain
VLTHELIHLALPDLPSAHRWLEEGIPTYLEPLLRLRAGRLDPAAFWAGLRADLPKGQPQGGDRGLDRTPTWGRTYWGGALFCFLADLQIREHSGGRKTLVDALRGITEAGMSAEQRGSIREVLRAGDRALGMKVLMPLYARMAEDPAPADLDGIWKKLGVGSGTFDEAAPEAGLRRAWGR